ncbi:DUF3592 domain-containing protein [Kocuria sediminis]|uniref:DUF3592 domain-containing protein n=1 Tax=Kocuria sediminis TaxID=1038857 RepID=A0A6N8GMU4_9MICC|nr:DUF3592 domain-containing protein [Kocuria sediminis]
MRIALYVIWALFVLATVLSLVHMARRAGRQERRAAEWTRVQATVTGSRAGWTSGADGTTRNRRFFALYRFRDARGRSVTGESEVPLAQRPVPGSGIDVAYDPAAPAESFQVTSGPRTVLGCLIPFFAVFSLVLLWFISVFPLP